MARYMKFERETVYRGVVLYHYTTKGSYYADNPDKYPVKQYTLEDGTVIHYNHAKAYGPYSTPAPAKTQAKSESRSYQQLPSGGYGLQRDPNVVAILVEKTEIDWEAFARLD